MAEKAINLLQIFIQILIGHIDESFSLDKLLPDDLIIHLIDRIACLDEKNIKRQLSLIIDQYLEIDSFKNNFLHMASLEKNLKNAEITDLNDENNVTELAICKFLIEYNSIHLNEKYFVEFIKKIIKLIYLIRLVWKSKVMTLCFTRIGAYTSEKASHELRKMLIAVPGIKVSTGLEYKIIFEVNFLTSIIAESEI
ncbi:hypothetical protein BpHYR1_008469 [Brachionus plicatilis]|uniref:Uncharacterized protein n=1 Tax=Brachionus plicatilis TaxID=10195 RepID=A0A3M7S9W7_BRAPC|nr:hypothetical protein BpHYR1_008469 [Brachionus plicatilis]